MLHERFDQFFMPWPSDATYRNIVRRNMLHAFGHSVAACCDVLRHVGYCWLKFENGQIFYVIFVDVA